MQVRKKDTQRIYALKTIRKAHIAQRPGEITHILAERTVLALVNNPFIVPLKFSFQNPDKLYLVMSFGGCYFGTSRMMYIELRSSQWGRTLLSPATRGKVRPRSEPLLRRWTPLRAWASSRLQRCLSVTSFIYIIRKRYMLIRFPVTSNLRTFF